MRLNWTPHNATAFQLNTDPRWALLGLSGHGAPDTHVRTVATPERDEQIPLHATAQPRLLTLTLAIRGHTLAAYERNRATLAAAFAPWRDTGVRARPGTLTATLADGRIRALRAFPRQGLAWGGGRQHGAHTVESISLEAPDPFWYDPTPQSGSVTTAGPGNLRFDAATELGFPAGFGSDLPSVTATLANPGSVRSFPVWTVPGPSRNPSLRQAATGHTLAFGLTVPTGLSLRVRCGPQPNGAADAPGAHLIDDLANETNVLGALRPGARFWALGPGANTVVVSQEGPQTPTTAAYAFFPRHAAI